ncbi:MAG: hypothetical protein ACREKB_15825 [Candidatus Rokuibacteriota bacterium]
MSILRLLALLVTLLAPGVALACSCMWSGPFTKVALGTDLVVLAEVRSYYRHGMDVAIIEVLRGGDDRREIRVWGDSGALCRPYVSAFPRGTRWIFALKRLGEPTARDYAISVCGEYWLEVRGGQAVGRIAVVEHGRMTESAPLPDMLAWIRSGGATPLAPVPIAGPPGR